MIDLSNGIFLSTIYHHKYSNNTYAIIIPHSKLGNYYRVIKLKLFHYHGKFYFLRPAPHSSCRSPHFSTTSSIFSPNPSTRKTHPISLTWEHRGHQRRHRWRLSQTQQQGKLPSKKSRHSSFTIQTKTRTSSPQKDSQPQKGRSPPKLKPRKGKHFL